MVPLWLAFLLKDQNLYLTPEQDKILGEKYESFVNNPNISPRLKALFTRDVFDKLKVRKTVWGTTLSDILDIIERYPRYGPGLAALDPDCYYVFYELYHPIVTWYHAGDGYNLQAQPLPNFKISDEFVDLDPSAKHISDIGVCIIRNLSSFPFPARMSRKQLLEVEKIAKNIFADFTKDLKGEYFSLFKMPDIVRDFLDIENLLYPFENELFKNGDVFPHFPQGSGLFFNTNRSVFVWVNSEDHFRIMVKSRGSNIRALMKLFDYFASKITEKLEFIWDDTLGFLTFNPMYIGTGLFVTSRVTLPELSKNSGVVPRLSKIAGLTATQESNTATWKIFNKYTYGFEECDIMNHFFRGLKELVRAEVTSETSFFAPRHPKADLIPSGIPYKFGKCFSRLEEFLTDKQASEIFAPASFVEVQPKKEREEVGKEDDEEEKIIELTKRASNLGTRYLRPSITSIKGIPSQHPSCHKPTYKSSFVSTKSPEISSSSSASCESTPDQTPTPQTDQEIKDKNFKESSSKHEVEESPPKPKPTPRKVKKPERKSSPAAKTTHDDKSESSEKAEKARRHRDELEGQRSSTTKTAPLEVTESVYEQPDIRRKGRKAE